MINDKIKSWFGKKAEPVVETPAVETPAVETPTEPVVETPTEPVVETPTEPVVETPMEEKEEFIINPDSNDKPEGVPSFL